MDGYLNGIKTAAARGENLRIVTPEVELMVVLKGSKALFREYVASEMTRLGLTEHQELYTAWAREGKVVINSGASDDNNKHSLEVQIARILGEKKKRENQGD